MNECSSGFSGSRATGAKKGEITYVKKYFWERCHSGVERRRLS